jgi:hypothetical protein
LNLQQETARLDYIVYGQILSYCEQVLNGAKLAAQIIINKKYRKMVCDTILNEKCKFCDKKSGNDYYVIFIYKYPYVRILINELFTEKSNPKLSDIWAAGKLFGYSDYEIGEYLKGHGYVKNCL